MVRLRQFTSNNAGPFFMARSGVQQQCSIGSALQKPMPPGTGPRAANRAQGSKAPRPRDSLAPSFLQVLGARGKGRVGKVRKQAVHANAEE